MDPTATSKQEDDYSETGDVPSSNESEESDSAYHSPDTDDDDEGQFDTGSDDSDTALLFNRQDELGDTPLRSPNLRRLGQY